MPQRTNKKQRVVAQLRRNFAGDEWAVTESKMLVDGVTRQRREVDVVVEQTLATGEQIVISVEVRGESRPMSVTAVEGLISKHRHLPTTTLVLVSWSGFTRTVYPVVEAEGGWVKAVQIEIDNDATQLKMRTKCWQAILARVDVKVTRRDGTIDITDDFDLAVDADLYDCGEIRVGSLRGFVEAAAQGRDIHMCFVKALGNWAEPTARLRLTSTPQAELYLLDVDLRELVRFESVNLTYDTAIEDGLVTFDMWRHEMWRHGRQSFAHAVTMIFGQPVSMVLTDLADPDGAQMNISPVPPN